MEGGGRWRHDDEEKREDRRVGAEEAVVVKASIVFEGRRKREREGVMEKKERQDKGGVS